jgi:beta-lactamase regulating signal transducer with metallopeptidase domain
LIASNVLIASLVALAAWWVERRLAWHAVARVLWVLVLVKLITPPLVTARLVELPAALACTVGACGCAAHATDQTVVGAALRAAFCLWLVGASVTAGIAGWRWLRLQRLLAHAQPASAEWQSLARRLGEQLGLRRIPDVVAVPGRLPPLVAPGRRPRLVLPAELLGSLDAPQRSALVLHELEHIRRSDHLVRLLELAVNVAYWWLPALRTIGRRLRSCEETCCDAAVMAHLPLARRDYARLLLEVVDFADPLPRLAPQATGMSAAHDLEARLRAILGGTASARRPRIVGILVVGFALAALPWGVGFEFARASQVTVSKPQAGELRQSEGRLQKPTPDAAPRPQGREMTESFAGRHGCNSPPPPPPLEVLRCPDFPDEKRGRP